MNRRQMIHVALFLGAGSCARPFAGRLWAQAIPAAGKATRAVFDDGGRRSMAAIAELIIPATDTPGAIEAGVPGFIEFMLADWCTEPERRAFLTGLESVRSACRRRFGHDFADASVEQQTRILEDAQKEADRYEPPPGPAYGPQDYDLDAPFFFQAKEFTVLGYYTSEIGATRELKYTPVPGSYNGSFPFNKIGRQWSF